MKKLLGLLSVVFVVALTGCDDGEEINGLGPNNAYAMFDELDFKIVDENGDNMLSFTNGTKDKFVGMDHIYIEFPDKRIVPCSMPSDFITPGYGDFWADFKVYKPGNFPDPVGYFGAGLTTYLGPYAELSFTLLTNYSSNWDFDLVIAEKGIRHNFKVKYTSICTEYNRKFLAKYYYDGKEVDSHFFTIVL